MEKINASITPMEEMEIFGIPALYTPYKVSCRTVHLGLYCYELHAGPDRWPCRLVKEAEAAVFSGTVLTLAPIAEVERGGKPIGPGDFTDSLKEGYYTPAGFEAKYLTPGLSPLQLEQIYGANG